MKSILYVGATLMIGASIYGFIDYRKTSRNKQFSTMYETKEVKEPVVVRKEEPAKKEEVTASKEEKKESPEKVTTTTTGNTPVKYTTVKKKKFNTRLFSRSRPPIEKVIVIEEPRQ